jgi:hypothetical protein
MKKTSLVMAILISVALGFSSARADAPENSIQIEPDCLQVEILDAPLPAVAQALSRESGIEIRLPGSLMNEFITTQLSAKNCSSAVLTLLQDFSMMEFWGDDEQLVAVQLLSRKQAWVPEAAPETASVSLVSTQADTVEPPLVRMAKALDKQQIRTLIDVGKGKLPPSDVMYNPVYDPYLSKAGLRQPEDWEDKKKVKTLRRHALRAWMRQRKASQSR